MPRRPTPRLPLASTAVLCAALLLGAGVLLGCGASAREDAQEDARANPEAETPEPSAVVTFAFRVPAPAEALAPSAPVVAELARDPHLGRLTVASGSEERSGRVLDAEFAFGTVAAFLAWREQAGTAALLDRVAALSPDTTAFRPRLSVRRPSLYRSVAGRVEAGSGGRPVESVTCNEDCSRIDVKYKTRANEAGRAGSSEGTGDAGDIDAVTLVCKPGLAGTIEECKVSN